MLTEFGVLGNTNNISNVAIERRIPCNRLMISAWEHTHNVALPDDLKEFYSTTDGFKLTWEYNRVGGNKMFSGEIIINSLSNLKKLGELNNGYGGWVELFQSSSWHTTMNTKSGVFILNDSKLVGKICLIYTEKENDDKHNSIWLLDRAYKWHSLSPSFNIYFRMALVHLGIPLWQLRFTHMGLTPDTKEIIMLLAPNVLNEDFDFPSPHQNHLNLSIFKNNINSSSIKDSNSNT